MLPLQFALPRAKLACGTTVTLAIRAGQELDRQRPEGFLDVVWIPLAERRAAVHRRRDEDPAVGKGCNPNTDFPVSPRPGSEKSTMFREYEPAGACTVVPRPPPRNF